MKNFLIAFLLLIVLAGAAFGTLAYLGVLNPRPVPVVRQAPGVPEGTVAVPVAIRHIAAYQKVTRDDLLNPQSAQPRFVYLRPTKGPNAPITNLADIIGRVLRHDKDPVYVFTEADFFPRGTEPGDAAAIPPGKRAMTIDASKLSGIYPALPGNHVDLVASQVIDNKGAKGPNYSSLLANPNAIPPGAVKRATFTVLVQDGVVITPVTRRDSTYMGTGDGLMPSQVVKKKPVEEIMIAMDPDEVPKLTEALAAGETINCFLHSAQPTTAAAEKTEIPDAPDTTQPAGHAVEKIVGRQHNFVYLPSTAESPTESSLTPPQPTTGGEH